MELLSVVKSDSLVRSEYFISPSAMSHVLQSEKDINVIYFTYIYFL